MMESRDEARRLREAFAATSPDDVPTADCPPAEQIWEAVRDELDPTELRQTLQHVASCPVCTEAWRLASEIEEGGTLGAGLGRERSEPRRSFRWLSVAAVAAAVFAVVVVGTGLKDRFSTGSIARSGTAEELSLVTDGMEMTRSQCKARWVPVEGATYDVQLLTESFELLSEEKGLTTPELLVPESLWEGLPTEAALLMRIQARRPHEMPKSGTIRLPC